MNHFTVVIIGGGPAGCTAAMALRKQGVRDVLVLESGAYDKFVIGESIPPNAKLALDQLEIYQSFLHEGHLPCYGTCSYWGDDRKGFNDTILSPHGHGWHLDRRKFNLFLSRQAAQLGAEVQLNAEFVHAERRDGIFELEYLQSGERKTVWTQFIVDASGPKSVFAVSQGSKRQEGSPLLCLTRRFKIHPEDQVSSLTRIEAVHNGWWYGAKLPNNELLVAFYTDQKTLKETKIQRAHLWMNALKETKSIKDGVHEERAIGTRVKGFQANSFCLDKVVGQNWMAIGDAASSYDPITSRGVYKSLTDAIIAAEGVVNGLQNPEFNLAQFEQYVKFNYKAYLLERAHYYQLEQRWKEAPFWAEFHKLSRKTDLRNSLKETA